jgi:hypothetical protein
MHARSALIFAATMLTACMTRPPPSAPEGDGEANPPSVDVAATRDAPAGPMSTTPTDAAVPVSASGEAARQCRMTVIDAEGCTPAEVEALIAPARQSIEECAGAKGGKVVVGVRSRNGKLTFDVEPNASLDPTEKRCILDALSKIPSDAQQRMTGEPRADGFTSHITIEW